MIREVCGTQVEKERRKGTLETILVGDERVDEQGCIDSQEREVYEKWKEVASASRRSGLQQKQNLAKDANIRNWLLAESQIGIFEMRWETLHTANTAICCCGWSGDFLHARNSKLQVSWYVNDIWQMTIPREAINGVASKLGRVAWFVGKFGQDASRRVTCIKDAVPWVPRDLSIGTGSWPCGPRIGG